MDRLVLNKWTSSKFALIWWISELVITWKLTQAHVQNHGSHQQSWKIEELCVNNLTTRSWAQYQFHVYSKLHVFEKDRMPNQRYGKGCPLRRHDTPQDVNWDISEMNVLVDLENRGTVDWREEPVVNHITHLNSLACIHSTLETQSLHDLERNDNRVRKDGFGCESDSTCTHKSKQSCLYWAKSPSRNSNWTWIIIRC